MSQYLFRLDDICPTMRWVRFMELCQVFADYQVAPIMAIVPDNKDPTLIVDPPQPQFWPTIISLVNQDWIVAQHGHQHNYLTMHSGLLGMRQRSEFAGLNYASQHSRIAAGQALLADQLGFQVQWWSAPAHSLDLTTCRVLRELKFTHVSDGISLFPFKTSGLTWVPHQTWSFSAKPIGLWTIGIHLNTMTNRHVSKLRNFLHHHAADCRNIDLTPRFTPLDPLFRLGWYTQFKILRGVKTRNYVRHHGKSIF